MTNISLFLDEEIKDLSDPVVYYKHIQGGNVPGGHNVIYRDNEKNPFITPMKEYSSIPLEYVETKS